MALNGVNLNKNRYTDVLPCMLYLSLFTSECLSKLNYFALKCDCITMKLEDKSFCYQIAVMLLISVDKSRVVLNSCKDYRPAANGYINASLVMV